jgi:hypothetical protein
MSEHAEFGTEGWRTADVGSHPSRPDGAAGALASRWRAFRDQAGHVWSVAEQEIPPEERTPGDDAAEAMGFRAAWLVFSCGEVRRRLLLFPRRWHALGAGELEQLCSRARRVLDD